VRDAWQSSGVIVVDSTLPAPELTEPTQLRIGRLNLALLLFSVVSSLVMLTLFAAQMGLVDAALRWMRGR
jgi:hypothetical protein